MLKSVVVSRSTLLFVYCLLICVWVGLYLEDEVSKQILVVGDSGFGSSTEGVDVWGGA